MASLIYDPKQLRIGRTIPLIVHDPISRYLEMDILSRCSPNCCRRFRVRLALFAWHCSLGIFRFFNIFGPICGAGGSPSPDHQSKGARSTLASWWLGHGQCRDQIQLLNIVEHMIRNTGTASYGPMRRKTTARSLVRVKSVNANSYKFIERQGFDVWVFWVS